MGVVSFVEAKRRSVASRQRRAMRATVKLAFGDIPMLDNATLVVWTKAQMRGVRATIKRLGLA